MTYAVLVHKEGFFMDNLMMKFQGFHPSDFTVSYLQDKMTILQNEAPNGSRLQASFSRRDHFFKGVVTINSSAGKFFAMASGIKVKEVTHKLNEQIRKQFERWKSRRHHRESIKNLNFDFENHSLA